MRGAWNWIMDTIILIWQWCLGGVILVLKQMIVFLEKLRYPLIKMDIVHDSTNDVMKIYDDGKWHTLNEMEAIRIKEFAESLGQKCRNLGITMNTKGK